MDKISVDLSGLSAEEILKINSVLERNEKVRRQESQRCRQIKFATFANKRDFQRISRATGDWFSTLKKSRESDNSIGGSKSSLWSGGLASSIPNPLYHNSLNKANSTVPDNYPVPTPRASPRQNPPSAELNSPGASIIGRIRELEVKRKGNFKKEDQKRNQRTNLASERPKSEPYKLNGYSKLSSSESTRPSSNNTKIVSDNSDQRRRSVHFNSDDSGMPQEYTDTPLETPSDRGLLQAQSDLGEIITELDEKLSQGRPLPPPRPSLERRTPENSKSRRPSSSVKSRKASRTPQIEASLIEEDHRTKRQTPLVKENDTREGSSSQFDEGEQRRTEEATSAEPAFAQSCSSALTLSYRGTIRFALRYNPDEKTLEAVAVSGENLAVSATWPYVKVHIFPGIRGKQKGPAQNKPSALNPEFNHLFTFNSMRKSIMAESGIHISCFNSESIRGDRLIGNCRIGPHCCLPLEELPTGPRPENLIWTQIQEGPNKWHYINLEMNLNKYTDVIPNG
ncbi:Oidioi.mRNA.OKI2018_I69.PAR.g11978.t1.cds [Oikopleura dioica]|uniref:Oidioi.mRNA.OKI2018_I69.PAR.g11978.t1.cds n=1 Tax=Oikopleura dioica TaxID=34765 RepID=A0ABN7S3R3_OIKDI|nr:Oidioi.mRNA.OKI2018_I69.PAR.g11978.t1.cds [Oikopleura dioica]